MSIQTYCDKTKGKPSAVVATVLRQALTANGIYFFSPLFHMPEVQQLESDATYAAVMGALKLIMYGTYKDLDTQTAAVKEIFASAVLVSKLRQLTIVSLASNSRRLSYNDVGDATAITDVRELEDLVIDSVTEGLIQGRVDQKNRVVEIHECVARDVNFDQLDGMITTLDAWVGRCDRVISELNNAQKITADGLKAEGEKAREFDKKEAVMLDICKKHELEREEAMEEIARRGGGGLAGADDPRRRGPMLPGTRGRHM